MEKLEMKGTWFYFFLLGMVSCHGSGPASKVPGLKESDDRFRIFSTEVKDSFDVFVHLPDGYNSEKAKKYPVVYLMDANLYFDVMAAVLRRYTEVGLAPDVILIGVGYKDFPAMDSLRNRDDTYPEALPEYEMTTSGGAERTISFLGRKLTTDIDRRFRTDTLHRILMGHSLGGYLTSYAMFSQLSGGAPVFTGFVAASPSLAYNNHFLLKRLVQANPVVVQTKPWKVYMAFGGSDYQDPPTGKDMSWSDLEKSLNLALRKRQSAAINFRLNRFSGLEHMETQLPAFIQGLQWILADSTKQ